MTAEGLRAEQPDGHLSVRVDGQHPPEIVFFFERSTKRIAPAAAAAAAWHTALVVLLLMFVRHGSPGVYSVDKPFDGLVWYDDARSGGGGGGGGDETKGPPRLAERPGRDATTVPVAHPVSMATTTPAREPDPTAGVNIPVRDMAAAQELMPGALVAPAAPASAQGPGRGNGAGSGDGTGIGRGRGPGFGDGVSGNTGGGPYRPGSGIVSPRVLREVKPQYTSDAMRAKVQGTVLLACVVRPDGTVGDVQVVRSLDPTFGLDAQAIAAVRQWKFAAGTRMGIPVPVQITIELTFTLR